VTTINIPGTGALVAGADAAGLQPIGHGGQRVARHAVDPGGAQVQWQFRPAHAGVDAATDAVATFQHRHLVSGCLQRACRG
jgi:hypothetical protein